MIKISDRVTHPIKPVYNQESKILILGSFPSVKSREGEFFYHHPQNRFWKVVSSVIGEELPLTIQDKKDMLLRCKIAVWDVIESCEITGSSDSSIKNVVPNDITEILSTADIRCLIANGGTAYQLYQKYLYPITGKEIMKLPSTSPANASYTLECLVKEWSVITDYLN